ncbi:MAG: hypothetical protein IJW03_02620, partial [Clostridia bacterium]|nr:hypothetical protein [Clostridia bacterium]
PPEDADFVAHTRDYLFNELYIDYNHSTPCWEDIFSLGLSGILERAKSYRAKHEPLTDRQRAYFDGIEISFSALIDLFKRYVSELRERVEPRLVIMREAIDIVLHPTAVSGDDGLCAFSALVRTYFAKGGHSVQFNVFSASELIEAQKHPEKYRNLQIRVCGWNVYFVELEKKLQDAFIRECLHREGAI